MMKGGPICKVSGKCWTRPSRETGAESEVDEGRPWTGRFSQSEGVARSLWFSTRQNNVDVESIISYWSMPWCNDAAT
jgi:hypothetical protein